MLEAIRLAKALLAQRYNGEAAQVLANLVGNPHPALGANGQLAALAGNSNFPIQVEMMLGLDQEEVDHIKNGSQQLALMRLQTELARSINENSLELTQYLSTSDGLNRLKINQQAVSDILSSMSSTTELNISFSIDVQAGRIAGADATAQSFLTYLEQSLQPVRTHLIILRQIARSPRVRLGYSLAQAIFNNRYLLISLNLL